MLKEAIEHRQIEALLQPIVSLRTGTVLRLEAVARWERSASGAVAPSVFIPLADRSGLITALTEHVIRESVRALAQWRRRLPDLRVVVNLSGVTLLEPDLPGLIVAVLRDAGCPPHWLGVELTEDALAQDPERARGALESLRALGLRVDIDDFGSGYSSMGRLAEMPVDGVKIDRQFVTPLTVDHRREAVVRATISLGHDLGFEVVAEGVEDRVTWNQLVALGCDSAQGYHIARPMAVDDVDGWLSSWDSGLAFMRKAGIGADIVAHPGGMIAEPGGRSILVVDDEPSILEVVREILEREGFRVLTAANGSEALTLVEQARPHVVLLDMNMPMLDGEGFTRTVRERGHSVPIVVMTAGSSAERWAQQLRADGFLSKPFDMDRLIDVAHRFANGAN